MANSVPLDDLIDRAIKGVKDIQSKNEDELKAWLKGKPLTPPNIPVRGGMCLTTDDGLQALHDFGRRWRDEESSRRDRIEADDAARLAVKVFGDMIDGVVLKDLPPNTEAKSAFKDLLQANLDALSHELEFSFPCRLFDDDQVQPFEVGPVRFRKREVWIDDVASRASPTPLSWVTPVKSFWSGQGPAPVGSDLTAKAVTEEFISNWVAAVSVSGRTLRSAQSVAELAVRTAIDTLGLPLHTPLARNLRGPGDEVRARLKRSFVQMKGRDITYSSSLDLPRLAQRPGDYAAFVADTAPLRSAAGKTITTILEATPSASTPMLQQRWVEALHWFGEARREIVPRIALVKYGIVLDVLAEGKRTKGILSLCCALFDMSESDSATSTGLTLKALIKKIYEEGRSQIAHGGNLFLRADIPIACEDADFVAAAALERYLRFVDVYSGPDDYSNFLKDIPALRTRIT